MKKIAKRSVEVEVQPEDISPLELLQPGKLNKRTAMHILRKRSALLPAAQLSFCRQ